MSTTYLITGANRGIGLGLVTSLLLRPNTTVIAAVRDTTKASHLASLPTGTDSKVLVIKIDSADHDTAAVAIAELKSKGIDRVDVVIANAGISNYYGSASTTPLSSVRDHFEVNTLGPLALFQAVWPLLQKSSHPKFVGISTGLASIADMGSMPVPATAYGISKIALNYLAVKLHFEQEASGLVSFVISPGWVQTDMGDAGAKAVGMESAPVTLEQSVQGILGKIDGATREKTGGTFQSFDETEYKW